MTKPLVSIQIVVHNGARYLEHCLTSVLAQTYDPSALEIVIFDNASTDHTRTIANEWQQRCTHLHAYRIIEHPQNIGMWPGQETALAHSNGPYVLALAVDVVLDSYFIERAVAFCEHDPAVGAVGPKIFQSSVVGGTVRTTQIIDTCGFEIYRSRRVINIGHGQEDSDIYARPREIFAVEGACPFFRRNALESIRVQEHIVDTSYFWYGDDLDIGWRLHLAGWTQWLAPDVIAWHDRQTTKSLSSSWRHFITSRTLIPIEKRRLDWRNVRFTIIKNDYIINVLRDLPYIAAREMMLLVYILIYEPSVLREIPALITNLPRLIGQRRIILRHAKATPADMRRWFR